MIGQQTITYDRTAVFVLPYGRAVPVDPNKVYTPDELKKFAHKDGDVYVDTLPVPCTYALKG